MSADNWAICPQCLDRANAASKERLQVPVDPEAFRTFREDYEFFGASDGKVVASYSGHCQVCGLGVDFKHEHRFYGDETEEQT